MNSPVEQKEGLLTEILDYFRFILNLIIFNIIDGMNIVLSQEHSSIEDELISFIRSCLDKGKDVTMVAYRRYEQPHP
ncbi:hypothetical protein CAP36_07950 [Chitinophagaceae bacterium IBVUCB2]|nr:hypothetical protein CAP36_07950 [Chitinophagaceae bacterium IBVUCB2]